MWLQKWTGCLCVLQEPGLRPKCTFRQINWVLHWKQIGFNTVTWHEYQPAFKNVQDVELPQPLLLCGPVAGGGWQRECVRRALWSRRHPRSRMSRRCFRKRSVACCRTLCMSQLDWQELWRDAKLRLVTSSKVNTQPEGNTENTPVKKVQRKKEKRLLLLLLCYFVANSQQLFWITAAIHVTMFTSTAVTTDWAQLCQNPLCLTRLVLSKTLTQQNFTHRACQTLTHQFHKKSGSQIQK